MHVAIDNAREQCASGGIEHLGAARDLDSRIFAHSGDTVALDHDRALLDGVAAETIDHARADDRCCPAVECQFPSSTNTFLTSV